MPQIFIKITLTAGYGIISGAVATFLRTLQYSNYQEQHDVAAEHLLPNMAAGLGFTTSLSCVYHAFKWCKKTINTKRVVPTDTRILDDVVPSASIGKSTLPITEEGIEETEFERQISVQSNLSEASSKPLYKQNMVRYVN